VLERESLCTGHNLFSRFGIISNVTANATFLTRSAIMDADFVKRFERYFIFYEMIDLALVKPDALTASANIHKNMIP
jgi:hypothetical protein